MKKSPLILSLCVVSFLYGCTTPVSDREQDKRVSLPDVPEIEDIKDSKLSAINLLSMADNKDNTQATILLMQAAETFISEQQFEQALHISSELSKLELTVEQHNYNQLNLANALCEMGYGDLAATELGKIETVAPSQRQLLLQVKIKIQQDLLVDGIIKLLDYHQQYPVQSSKEVSYLYTLFSQLTPWQLSALKRRSAKDLTGWLAFSDIVAKHGFNFKNLNFELSAWQNTHNLHPANLLVADLSNKASEVESNRAYENIAVLIPLSGREAILGKTLQAGIVASYQLQTNKQITFIDTNAQQMDSIVSELHTLQPDFVIGPLLKQHVDSYLLTDYPPIDGQTNEPIKHSSEQVLQIPTSVENSNIALPHTWSTLLLNLPEHALLSENQFSLSMLPEDEAHQAAFSLSHQGYKNALVLSQNTAIGKRMAKSFAEQWQKQTNSSASIIYYPNGKQMQQAVKKGLDVTLSEERIYLLRNRIVGKVKAEARNRRDIDLIYMFATPDQAKLLKPYVDVNISPFADAIPIFASSRSHNVDLDRNTRRDLNGLTFTEIPWLLSPKQVNQTLFSDAKKIWPNRNSQLERIYAMGIDSLQLTDKVKLMQAIPMLRYQGETGTLQMDAKRIISRSLSWGKYRTSRIQSIDME